MKVRWTWETFAMEIRTAPSRICEDAVVGRHLYIYEGREAQGFPTPAWGWFPPPLYTENLSENSAVVLEHVWLEEQAMTMLYSSLTIPRFLYVPILCREVYALCTYKIPLWVKDTSLIGTLWFSTNKMCTWSISILRQAAIVCHNIVLMYMWSNCTALHEALCLD